MKYMGSKNRHAKEILPIILKNRGNMPYVEPMVGGANMIDKVGGIRLGADINEYLIALWQAVSEGWMPPETFTEQEYKDIRLNKSQSPPHLVGYAGFALSYSGKWFGGWCRDGKGKRDYVKEAYNNAVKQFPLLLGVKFICKSYLELDLKQPCVIYCDPPYAGTTKYKDEFNHELFWQWCRDMVKQGHSVFVSEYNAPEDFVCVWSKQVNNSLTKDTGSKKGVEKLFVHKSQHKE